MSLPVVLRPEAQAEFDEAFNWYEKQRPGLGVDFAAHVQDVLDRISASPELYAQVFQDVRRAVMRRFPYSVFYKIEPQRVVVLAIFHSSRDPKTWQARA
jgi:plasmid stabilization system protein ParE